VDHPEEPLVGKFRALLQGEDTLLAARVSIAIAIEALHAIGLPKEEARKVLLTHLDALWEHHFIKNVH
jgi:hypothetical protein